MDIGGLELDASRRGKKGPLSSRTIKMSSKARAVVGRRGKSLLSDPGSFVTTINRKRRENMGEDDKSERKERRKRKKKEANTGTQQCTVPGSTK